MGQTPSLYKTGRVRVCKPGECSSICNDDSPENGETSGTTEASGKLETSGTSEASVKSSASVTTPTTEPPKIPNGKWDLVSSDNFSAYLSEIGVGFTKRMIASKMKPTVEILQADGTYTLNTYSTLKNTSIKFKPGVEFNEETADGRIAKSTVTVEGNKLVHVQRIGNGESKIVREFKGDDMTAVFCANKVCSTRKYKKIA